MALSLSIDQSLDAAGLVDFYGESVPKWEKMAQKAYDHVREGYPPAASVRPDDVAKTLRPFVEVDEDLKAKLNDKKLRQRYWIDRFTDLVVDRCWTAISALKQPVTGVAHGEASPS